MRRILLFMLVLQVAAILPTVVRAADDLDSPAYWHDAQQQMAAWGNGFLVWESLRTGHWRIWTEKLDGTGLKQLSADETGREHYCPKISPDGKKIIYFSLPFDGSDGAPADGPGVLHLINADGTGDRVLVPSAHKYGAWDRAVVWFDNDHLAYINGDNSKTCEMDLKTEKSVVIIDGGGCWLPNTKRTNVVQAFNTFSLLDATTGTVTTVPSEGGCQPYFTQDGLWGFWEQAPGGPIGKMRLANRQVSTVFNQNTMPGERHYVYFPMVSAGQHLLAFGAADDAKLLGSYGGYVRSDYDIFVVRIDKQTLEVTGKPVRYTFDPKCDRFPDVYQDEPALGYWTNKAPFTVAFKIADAANYDWDYGDGTIEKAGSGKHVYAKPGSFVVRAVRGNETLLGEVKVIPVSVPRIVQLATEDGLDVKACFDEPVDFKDLSVQFASGAKIEKWASAADGSILHIYMKNKLPGSDIVTLNGATDFAQVPNRVPEIKLPLDPPLWPLEREGLLFQWQTGNKLNLVRDTTGSRLLRNWPLALRGPVTLDHDYRMVLAHGASAHVPGLSEVIGGAKATNQFTLEATLTPANLEQTGPANIISNSNIKFDAAAPKQRIFSLCQSKDKLIFILRSGECDQTGAQLPDLCTLPAAGPSHVVITFVPGVFTCYLNGKKILEKAVMTNSGLQGNLNWFEGSQFTIGNEYNGERPWEGTIEGLAYFAKALTPEQVATDYAGYQKIIAERKPVPVIELEGTLVARSKIPTLATIAPYRDALILDEYEVTNVKSGTYAGKKIRVARWAIMNGETLPITKDTVGQKTRLVVEPYKSNPQLHGLTVSDTLEPDFDAVQYYETSGD